jgi:hypothetical protein
MSQVVSVDSVDEEGLLDKMAAGTTRLDRATLAEAMRLMARTVSDLVGDGYRVHVGGLAQFFPVMSGKFDKAEDEYDAKRHEVGVAAIVGQKLVDEVKSKARLEKQKPNEQVPTPTFYSETGSQIASGHVVPGNIGTLHGRRLAFNRDAEDEGVFFVSSDGSKKDIRAKVYATVQPAEIVFQVPDGVGAGKWIIEVRARVRGGKQLRKGRISSALEGMRRI